MSFEGAAEDALKMGAALIAGVATIQKLTQLGGDRASEALTAIALVIETLEEGFAGKTSPDVIMAQFKAHQDALAAGDAAARKAEADKFGG